MNEKYTVYLGENLSGELKPDLVKEGEVLTGVKVVGLQGFLEFLELHLGLRSEKAPEALQLEAYLQALEKAKSGAFFESSLTSDPYSVTKDLYSKRLELLEGGMDFSDKEKLPKRFLDLKKVEDLFELKDSVADRALKILGFLKDDTILPLGNIKLVKPKTDFPPLYQALLSKLEKTGIHLEEIGLKVEAPVLKLLEVKNEFEATLAITQLLKMHPETISYMRSDDELLDLQCQNDGRPGLGAEVSSFARPVMQLVHLISEFLWEPLDPRRVIEFLNLPVKPLSGKLASRLSAVLTDAPGFGGKPWNDAVTKYFDEETDEDVKKKNQERLKFLFDRPHFPKSGAPLKEIAELYSFLAKYLRGRDFLTESEVVNSVCKLLNLVALRKTHLSKLELERLMDNNIPSLGFCERKQEVGAHQKISGPENLIGSIDRLIWYPFCDQAGGSGLFFWNQEEKAYLTQKNVKLLKPYEKVQRELNLHKRLLTSAQKEVFLIVPKTLNGESTTEHPMFRQIKVEKIEFKQLLEPLMEKVVLKPLPTIRDKWSIKHPELFVKRERESYSSLEKLFYWPWLYLLEVHAQVSSHSALSVDDDFKIRGTFTHKFFEEYFSNHKTPAEMKAHPAERWFDERSDKLIDQYGILWKQDGYETILALLKNQIRKGLAVLSQHLIDNNWTVEGMEKELSGQIFDKDFKGFMDMALVRGKERCVLDLKYAGDKKYREYIEKDLDLQLALYSKKHGNEDQPYCYTAYFIIMSSQLFSKEKAAFKNCFNKMVDNHAKSYEETWDRMEQTYHARRDELAKGEVVIRDELTLKHLKEENVEGDMHLDLSEIEGNKYHDFDVLLGFKRKA